MQISAINSSSTSHRSYSPQMALKLKKGLAGETGRGRCLGPSILRTNLSPIFTLLMSSELNSTNK